ERWRTGRAAMNARSGDGARLLLVALVGATLLSPRAATATTPTPTVATTADCQEHQAFVDGDQQAVAARLPRPYSAVLYPAPGHLCTRPELRARRLRSGKGGRALPPGSTGVDAVSLHRRCCRP